MSKLDDVLAKIKALKEEFKQVAKTALLDLTTDFFAQFPEVKTLTWTQYTPYFNDGDECVFGVHQVEFIPTDAESAKALGLEYEGDIEDAEWSEGEYASEYDLKGTYDMKTHSYSGGTERGAALRVALNNVEALLNQIEGVLEDVFGNHVRVFITANGSETEEYDHD